MLGSSWQGEYSFFVRNKEALPCVRRYSWWVRAVSGGNVFFAKYRGPFGGSLMSGGGISLRAAVDPAVGLSMYSTLPMEVIP